MTTQLLPSASTSDALQNAAYLAEQFDTMRQHQDYQAEDQFPHQEFDALREQGLLNTTLPGQPLDFQSKVTAELLHLLKLIGKGNLSVGRIYEGHINALYLIHLFGNPTQKERWYDDTEQHIFGVWNTQAQDGIKIQSLGHGEYQLKGAKTFCSGAQWVTRPIVTGQLISETGEDLGWQMCVVPLEQQKDLPVDASFWKPLGMKASVSHKIDFTDIILEEENLLGNPDEYHQQPYFSGGAVRFAAVQLGGAEAIFDATRKYLQKLQRTDDPYQQMRFGEMAILIESGNQWIQNAGKLADGDYSDEQIINYANMTRSAIEKIGLEVMRLSERCVGARGLLYPEPFALLHADLTTYLRQPAPDQALAQVGNYVGTKTDAAHALWSSQS
uniref:Acyl-CoA dehydrogenase family protein n=1 Tax=Roseihalotalea indica TaxID=2867963 RepID=A0AA49GNF6_9BACT|nr:acyl-CoA dehydrogenase family protein [Tunicatimonas sp. TK19036]